MPREFRNHLPINPTNPEEPYGDGTLEVNSSGNVEIQTGDVIFPDRPSPYTTELLNIYNSTFDANFQSESLCFLRDPKEGRTVASIIRRFPLELKKGTRTAVRMSEVSQVRDDINLEDLVNDCLRLQNTDKGPKHFAGNEEFRILLEASAMRMDNYTNSVEVKLKEGNVKFRFPPADQPQE